MNRKQRRETGVKAAPARDPVFQMRKSDLKKMADQIEEDMRSKITEELTNRIKNEVMVQLIGLPVLILKEQYGWGSKKRLPEFTERLLGKYRELQDGNLAVENLNDLLWEECGIRFVVTEDKE